MNKECNIFNKPSILQIKIETQYSDALVLKDHKVASFGTIVRLFENFFVP